ncbi:hypothetical protein BpHYR1_006684 [Brachionus plicatilis]|uniref:Uncharacterized protein n=1 Tax=Brachionus plicatilis TaxID=10195 RepID=A0A3M7PJS0_BRAPC|nr:hypothetical protein BpHYR1_006684 [Brachionus plicatilis]
MYSVNCSDHFRVSTLFKFLNSKNFFNWSLTEFGIFQLNFKKNPEKGKKLSSMKKAEEYKKETPWSQMRNTNSEQIVVKKRYKLNGHKALHRKNQDFFTNIQPDRKNKKKDLLSTITQLKNILKTQKIN